MNKTERTRKSSGRDVLLVILGIACGIFITRSWYERPREARPAPIPETVEQAEPEAEPAKVARMAQGLILPREGLPRSAGRPLRRVEKIEQEIPVSPPALPKARDVADRPESEDHYDWYGVESFTFRLAMLPPKSSSIARGTPSWGGSTRGPPTSSRMTQSSRSRTSKGPNAGQGPAIPLPRVSSR